MSSLRIEDIQAHNRALFRDCDRSAGGDDDGILHDLEVELFCDVSDDQACSMPRPDTDRAATRVTGPEPMRRRDADVGVLAHPAQAVSSLAVGLAAPTVDRWGRAVGREVHQAVGRTAAVEETGARRSERRRSAKGSHVSTGRTTGASPHGAARCGKAQEQVEHKAAAKAAEAVARHLPKVAAFVRGAGIVGAVAGAGISVVENSAAVLSSKRSLAEARNELIKDAVVGGATAAATALAVPLGVSIGAPLLLPLAVGCAVGYVGHAVYSWARDRARPR